MTEQAYEIACSVEAAPQCVTCSSQAENKCPACGDQVCEKHSWNCEVCFEPHCLKCLVEIESAHVCQKDKAAFLEEILAQKNADRVELAEDLRRCKDRLSGEYPMEQQIGFAEQMVERWIGRLSA